MICDLSIEALFKLARFPGGRTLSDLSISGLELSHIEPLIAKGWISSSIATLRLGQKKGFSKYRATSAGIDHLQHLVAHTRLQFLTPE